MSYFRQGQLFTFEDFCEEHDDNTRLVMVLSALERCLEPVVRKLESERMGRRDRYPVHVMMNCLVAGYVYQIPVKNELIRELRRNGSLRRLVGIETIVAVPNAWQFSRFLGRLDNCSTSDYGRVLKVAIAEDVRRFAGLWRDIHKWRRLYRKRSACEPRLCCTGASV